MKNILRHLSAFIAPIVMAVVVPYLIILAEHSPETRPLLNPSPILAILGVLVGIVGLVGFFATVRVFILIGNGTIMPWDPTRKLVIAGVYRHVRNPMILSLVIIQVGEALLFASWGTALLALLFFVINTVYFIYSEEPGLVKRFGEEYVEYKEKVPRWIPRLRPWQPGGSARG